MRYAVGLVLPRAVARLPSRTARHRANNDPGCRCREQTARPGNQGGTTVPSRRGLVRAIGRRFLVGTPVPPSTRGVVPGAGVDGSPVGENGRGCLGREVDTKSRGSPVIGCARRRLTMRSRPSPRDAALAHPGGGGTERALGTKGAHKRGLHRSAWKLRRARQRQEKTQLGLDKDSSIEGTVKDGWRRAPRKPAGRGAARGPRSERPQHRSYRPSSRGRGLPFIVPSAAAGSAPPSRGETARSAGHRPPGTRRRSPGSPATEAKGSRSLGPARPLNTSPR